MNLEQPEHQPETSIILIPKESKWESTLSRIDLVAFVITLLGIFLLGAVALVTALVHLANLISGLWSHSIGRWLIMILGLAILWVVVRWKKSSV